MSYATWNPTGYYEPLDVVLEGSNAYQAVVANFGLLPSANTPATWIPYNTGGGGVPAISAYLYSKTTQPLTGGAFTYDVAGKLGNITVPTVFPESKVIINVPGIYRVLFSIQCDKTAGGGGTTDFQAWVARNGTPEPWSNSNVIVSTNTEDILTVEVFVGGNIGDEIEVFGFSAGGFARALAIPITLPAVPVDIPSIITSITYVAPFP